MRVTTYDDSTAAALERIVAACEAGDHRSPLDEAARLHLRHHGLHGARLWLGTDGFALARAHDEHVELDLAVAPAARRTGQGRSLLAAALADAGDLPVRAWSHGDHPGAAALAQATGFRRTRELLVLARPLPLETATHATDPRIRAWRPEDADELLRVNAAAFAHHPEQGSMDAANLAERMAEPWFDPAGLLVAAEGDRLLGFHWTKQHGRDDGEIYVLAVDPAAHGRGLGTALGLAGLHHLAATGSRRAHLYVEADNAAALTLYSRLGFTTDHAHVQYARP